MNKVCIIGLDALEYNLVEKFDLDILKQKEYGKVNLEPAIVERKSTPISPIVWTSFMTGKAAKNHSTKGFSWNVPFLDIIYRIPTPQMGLEKKILNKIFDKDFPREVKDKTFIDELGQMVTFTNAPMYDFNFEKKGKIVKERGGVDETSITDFSKLSSSEKLKNLRMFSKYVFNKTIDKLNTKNDWKVFFTYFYWIDGIQHNFYMNKEILKEEYRRACDYVEDIKEKLDDDTLVLIVSDHGNQLEEGNGNHSKHGFYSLSEKRGLDNPKITDFYDFIMGEIDMPTRKDEKNIEKTLRKLGYI